MVSQLRFENRSLRFCLGDVYPSAAAHAELHWFFNAAEAEVNLPSNGSRRRSGVSHSSLEALEIRAEALHAAGKIRARLQSISVMDARALQTLYTERPWPPRAEVVLGPLMGAVEGLATVRAEYLCATFSGTTRTKTTAAWLEEIVFKKGAGAVAPWRRQAEMVCKVAVRAYERARGPGPSVVPEED